VALVLIVDDEECVRTYVKAVLRAGDSKVLEASNGREALELVKNLGQQIELIVADIQMPLMDGIQLANSVRVTLPQMPIVLITGALRDQWPGSPPNRCPVVQKPFSPASLLKAVYSALAESRPGFDQSASNRVA
jgi:CheY-like chemotaxis protein